MHPHTLTHSSTHSLVFFSCTGTTDTEFTSSSSPLQAAPSNETVVAQQTVYNITITTQTGQQYWSVSDIQSSYLWSKLKAK